MRKVGQFARRLWTRAQTWVQTRLSTHSGRLGGTTASIGVVVWYVDQHGDPPVYLIGLLTASFGAFLATLGARQQEQKEATQATAHRAEAKADKANDKADALGRVASSEHPDRADDLTPPLPPEVTGKDGGG